MRNTIVDWKYFFLGGYHFGMYLFVAAAVVTAEVYISHQTRLYFKIGTVNEEIVIEIIKHSYIFKQCRVCICGKIDVECMTMNLPKTLTLGI